MGTGSHSVDRHFDPGFEVPIGKQIDQIRSLT